MKIRNVVLLLLIAFLLRADADAQMLTVLHTFESSNDGTLPMDALILSGGKLYGTAHAGGSFDMGTVFSMNTDGSGFTNLHNFTGNPGGNDGAFPIGGLVLLGNTLFGTTSEGGGAEILGGGTVFEIQSDGSGYSNLFSLPVEVSVAQPSSALLPFSGSLYGTTVSGGDFGWGSFFSISTNGTDFATLFSFDYTNGSGLAAPLAISGDTFYGTTFEESGAGFGTVFSVKSDGSDFTNLYSFTGASDGARPSGGVVDSGGVLYGTAEEGGSAGTNPVNGVAGDGTVFKITTVGATFTVLHTFTNGIDGSSPRSGLLLSGNRLYGTAAYGGKFGGGTVFAINTDGSRFTTLYSFSNGLDGSFPIGGLALSGHTLYGTTVNGAGTIFALNLQSELNFVLQSTNLVLSWSDPAFYLQAAPAVSGPYCTLPAASSPYTNSMSSVQQFFRLASP